METRGWDIYDAKTAILQVFIIPTLVILKLYVITCDVEIHLNMFHMCSKLRMWKQITVWTF